MIRACLAAALLLAACDSSSDSVPDACVRDGFQVVFDLEPLPCVFPDDPVQQPILGATVMDPTRGYLYTGDPVSELEEHDPHRVFAAWAWPDGVTTADTIDIYWTAEVGTTRLTAEIDAFADATGCQALTMKPPCPAP